MRKIVWGIGIVFCVQVAFQLAMTANRSDSDYAAMRSPLQTGISVPQGTLDSSDLDNNIALGEPDGVDSEAQIQTRVLIRYVPVPEHRLPAAQPNSAGFKPVVITYDRTGALTQASTTTPERRTIPKTEAPNDDKRSLVSKVVTKPYDWLKAVGSKLR